MKFKSILLLLLVIKLQCFAQSIFCVYSPSCSPFPTSSLPNDIVSADFNQDGKADLAVEIQGSDSVTIFLGNNNGCFNYAYSKKTGYNPLAIAKADFNNDGKMDIALATAGNNAVSVLINTGTNFNNFSSFPVGLFPIAIKTADINNDGNSDVVTANNYGGISILKGKGDGTFFPSVDYTVGSYPRAVAVADFNSDGFADIVVGHDNSAFLSLLLNNGSGNFNTPTNFSSYYCPYLTTKDMNNDGTPDLIASIAGTTTALGVFICNGSGGFSAPTIHSIGIPAAAYRLVVEDINYDGNIDIAASCFFNSGMRVYLGPSLNFTNQFAGGQSSYLTSGDFNSDGRIDFATANRTSDNVSIFMNNAVFVNPTLTTICSGSSVTINATGASNYTWSTGSNSSSILVSPNNTTTYSVIGVNGLCSNTKSFTINVNPSPTVNIVATSDTICLGQSDTLIAISPTTTTSIVWGSLANGTTSVIFTPTITSIYGVTVYDVNGCAGTNSITITVLSCVGVSELSNINKQIKVFPNPFNDKITIAMYIPLDFPFQIYNSLGAQIYSGRMEKGKAEIDLSNQPSGIYFIKAGSVTKKIIKE